jgi:DNA-binding transcriptional ArsR family regulator
MSAAEAGRWLQMSQANVSYHPRMLERGGLVDLAEEVTIRGGRARRYRPLPPAECARIGHALASSLTDVEYGQAFLDVLIVELRRRHAQRSCPMSQTAGLSRLGFQRQALE